jgi:hypothetical protein
VGQISVAVDTNAKEVLHDINLGVKLEVRPPCTCLLVSTRCYRTAVKKLWFVANGTFF